LDGARGGVPAEGAVGGGTGMVCLGFKGGIGTASRRLPLQQGGFTVGVLVQCNFGARRDLRIAGVPVGEEIPDLAACIANNDPLPAGSARRQCDSPANDDAARDAPEQGSIIVVVATDAPLLPHQLKRIATRVSLGIGRQGGFGGNGSGDIFVAFSTANPNAWSSDSVTSLRMLTNDRISPLFQATAQATEAAITNALLAAVTTTGANDLRVYAMPVDRMMAAMRKYGRLK
ncbi:MAG: P1 family peptidase, partial [Gemmatimonadaceae bacterium]